MRDRYYSKVILFGEYSMIFDATALMIPLKRFSAQWQFPQSRNRTSSKERFSRVQLFATPWTVETRLLCPCNSSGKNTRVGCHSLLHRLRGGGAYHILRSWDQHPNPQSLLLPPGPMYRPPRSPGSTLALPGLCQYHFL